MTLALFHVPASAWGAAGVGDSLTLEGQEARHAAAAARTGVGEQVYLSDGAGRRARAEVTAVDRTTVRARLLEVELRAEPEPRFVLVQALAKGDRDEQAIEAATELGVDEVVPWQAARSIVRWRPDREDRGRARWQSVVTAATKQCRRHRIPAVAPLARQGAVLERVAAASLALVLHESAGLPLAGLPLPEHGDVVVVVGPEGGITPDELAVLTAAGARPVRLGREVLRSSSAGPAALAVLNAARRWR